MFRHSDQVRTPDRGMLTSMTSRDPELTADVELRNALYQLQVYEAIAIAANDAHGVLDVMLSASDSAAARRALEQGYGFTEVQACAVMDVQFRRMTSMDRRKIEQRHHELVAQVAVLEEELGGA